MDELFDLDYEEMEELKNEITRAVNEGIEDAVRAGMYMAETNVKISVKLRPKDTAGGAPSLLPEFTYKVKNKLGLTYERGKGTALGRLTLVRGADGFWRARLADEQMSIGG